MKDIKEKCERYGYLVGSRALGLNIKSSDYDYIMTRRDFFNAFTDEEIEELKEYNIDNSSVMEMKVLDGYKVCSSGEVYDIILADTKKDYDSWVFATEMSKHVLTNHNIKLGIKSQRVRFFEEMIHIFKRYDK